MLVYETQRKGHRKAKPIYVDVKRRDAIIEKVNSGFVYTMLGIPEEMFTPMFATSRISGWCAHRLEELVNAIITENPGEWGQVERWIHSTADSPFKVEVYVE